MVASALINTINPAVSTAAASPNKTVGKDEFLKLLVTQLRAQNPLNPMDSTGFTAQLAQFSSLEQLTNLNQGMSSLVLFQGSLQNTLAAGLINRQITTVDGTQGLVQSVLFDGGGATLTLDNGTKVPLGQIKEIKGGI